MDSYTEPTNISETGAKNDADDSWSKLLDDFGVEPASTPESLSQSTKLAERRDDTAELSMEQYLSQPAHTMEASLACASSYLPESRVKEINSDLRRIDHIVQYETIGALEELGKVTPEQKELAIKLQKDGYVGEMMTPDEAERVYRYQHDADEEVKEAKIEEIAHLVSSIRTGVRLERAWTPNQERFLDYITTKKIAYDFGRVRTDLPFDIKAMYLDEHAPEQINFYRFGGFSEPERLSYDDAPSVEMLANEYEIPIFDLTVEEYLEDFDGDEDYIFAYGPYTYGDIRRIESFCSPYSIEDGDVWGANQTRRSVAWVQPISSRLLDTFAPLYQDGKRVGTRHHDGAINEFRQDAPLGYSAVERGSNLTEALTLNYIAKDILKNRRPKARDLMALATSIGEATEDINSDSLNENQKKAYRRLNHARSYMAKYMLEAIQMDSKEAEKLYGKARPTSKEFYQDARRRSEGWTEKQSDYCDEARYDTMTKMAEWLLQCEAAMLDLRGGGQEGGADERPSLGRRISEISEALGEQ